MVTTIYFTYILNGGVINLALPIEELPAKIMVDLTVILAMLVLVSLLGIGKNVVQVIDLVSAKSETSEL